MEIATNLQAASTLLRDFYTFDNRLCNLYASIHGDTSDETAAMLRQETDHVESLIKQMIETAALDESAA